MSGGGGSPSTTSTVTSQPPPQFLNAYEQVLGQATSIANNPALQHGLPIYAYPSSQQIAPLNAQENQGISEIQGLQGVANPYIAQGANEFASATQPLAPTIQPYLNTAQGSVNQASGTIGNAVGTIGGGLGTYGQALGQYGNASNIYGGALENYGTAGGSYAPSAAGIFSTLPNMNFTPQPITPDVINQYRSPFTQDVARTTEQQFQNLNAQQQEQLQGSEISQHAFGGDRAGIAGAALAGQQASAEAPVLAGIENQGFQTALATAEQEQQLGLAAQQAQAGATQAGGAGILGAGQEIIGAGQGIAGVGAGQAGIGQGIAGVGAGQVGAGQAELGAAQGQLGASQAELGISGQQLGAEEANAWLASQAGFGLPALGMEAQNAGLQGASSLINAGGLEQQNAQALASADYQNYLQYLAYPFQTTQFLANIAEGTGGAAGGTSTTSQPGPSQGSQALGLGLTGAALAGISGFNPLLGAGIGALGGLLLKKGGGIPHKAPGGVLDFEEGPLGLPLHHGAHGPGPPKGVAPQPPPDPSAAAQDILINRALFRPPSKPAATAGGTGNIAADIGAGVGTDDTDATGGSPIGYAGGSDVTDDGGYGPPGPPPGIAAAPPPGYYDRGIASDIGYAPQQLDPNRYKEMTDQAKWSGLLGAGLGIMAGRSKYAAQNIGAGGLQGVRLYEQGMTEANRYREKGEEEADTGAYRKASLGAHLRQLDQAAAQAAARLKEEHEWHDTESQNNQARLAEEERYHTGELGVRGAELGIQRDRLNQDRFTYLPSEQQDPNDPTKTIKGFMRMSGRQGEAPTFLATPGITTTGKGGRAQIEQEVYNDIINKNPGISPEDAWKHVHNPQGQAQIGNWAENHALTAARQDPQHRPLDYWREQYGAPKHATAANTASPTGYEQGNPAMPQQSWGEWLDQKTGLSAAPGAASAQPGGGVLTGSERHPAGSMPSAPLSERPAEQLTPRPTIQVPQSAKTMREPETPTSGSNFPSWQQSPVNPKNAMPNYPPMEQRVPGKTTWQAPSGQQFIWTAKGWEEVI